MNPVSQVLILAGALLSMFAAVGLLRFSTPYARFHAAGKASPIAFLLVGAGASLEVGLAGAAQLATAAVALVLTLPAATHLLFRATHRTIASPHLRADALAGAELAASQHERGRPDHVDPALAGPHPDTDIDDTDDTDDDADDIETST